MLRPDVTLQVRRISEVFVTLITRELHGSKEWEEEGKEKGKDTGKLVRWFVLYVVLASNTEDKLMLLLLLLLLLLFFNL